MAHSRRLPVRTGTVRFPVVLVLELRLSRLCFGTCDDSRHYDLPPFTTNEPQHKPHNKLLQHHSPQQQFLSNILKRNYTNNFSTRYGLQQQHFHLQQATTKRNETTSNNLTNKLLRLQLYNRNDTSLLLSWTGIHLAGCSGRLSSSAVPDGAHESNEHINNIHDAQLIRARQN